MINATQVAHVVLKLSAVTCTGQLHFPVVVLPCLGRCFGPEKLWPENPDVHEHM